MNQSSKLKKHNLFFCSFWWTCNFILFTLKILATVTQHATWEAVLHWEIIYCGKNFGFLNDTNYAIIDINTVQKLTSLSILVVDYTFLLTFFPIALYRSSNCNNLQDCFDIKKLNIQEMLFTSNIYFMLSQVSGMTTQSRHLLE